MGSGVEFQDLDSVLCMLDVTIALNSATNLLLYLITKFALEYPQELTINESLLLLAPYLMKAYNLEV